MKMKVTYEEADIKRLIRNNLAKQGITVSDADIEFSKKCVATASIETEIGEETEPDPAPVELTTEQRTNHTHGVMTRPDMGRPPPAPPPAPKQPAPPLEVVEGGNNPVDMSDVFRQSQKLAQSREAPFPSPKQHSMLEGESTEWPGAKE